MALFSKKQNTETGAAAATPKKEVKQAPVQGIARDVSRVLANPRITEKASDLQSRNNAYVFDISSSATKTDIAKAVRQMYKVTPVKVRVVTVTPKQKRSMRTGRTGTRSGGRKAYVFLKKGDSITLA